MPASSFTPYDPVPLVLAAQRGNQAAFDALISLYQYRILRQCRGFFLQGAEFEDVLQEGRIGFFHAVRSFSVHRSIPFDSYVSICVKRQLADAVRMFSRKKHRPLNTYVSFDSQTQSKSECLTPQFGCFSPEPLDPAEIMASKQAVRLVRATIEEKLSPFEQQVLQQYMEGNSYQEIALQVNKPVKSVDNAIQRIRRKLGSLLPQAV